MLVLSLFLLNKMAEHAAKHAKRALQLITEQVPESSEHWKALPISAV